MRVTHEEFVLALDYIMSEKPTIGKAFTYRGLPVSLHVCHLKSGKPVFYVEDEIGLVLNLTNLDKPKQAEPAKILPAKTPDSTKKAVREQWKRQMEEERASIANFADVFDEEL